MRRRTLALTSASAVVAAMTVLPTISAAAAEPLVDGAYALDVAGSTLTVAVADGAPGEVTGLPDGWLVEFSFDAGGVLLNELVVTLPGDDGTVYDVTIDLLDVDGDGAVDDYTPTVVERLPDDGEATDPDEVVDEPEDVVQDPEGDGDPDGDPGDEPEETVEEPEDLLEDDEATGADHGAIVSTVAACAPRGREARDAGLPGHGYFVSAAARGGSVTWTLVDEAGTETVLEADLATLDGANAFCAAVTSDGAEEPDGADEQPDQSIDEQPDGTADASATEQSDEDDRRGPPEGRSRGKGRGGPPEGVPGRGPRG